MHLCTFCDFQNKEWLVLQHIINEIVFVMLEKHFVTYDEETEFLSNVFRLTSSFKAFNAKYLLSNLHPKHISGHIKTK
jgi:hypothetical protein